MFPTISPKQSFPALEAFDEWSEKKKILHNREIFYLDEEGVKKSKLIFKEWEIWWTSMGQNIGSESYGKWEQFARPVYIFRKFSGEAFLGIPMTSQEKDGSWYYPYSLEWRNGCLILLQMKYFSSKRLLSKITDVVSSEQVKIQTTIKEFLHL